MHQQPGIQFIARFITLCIASAPLCGYAAGAADTATIQSVWNPQEIRYSYTGFTTAYSCDAIEDKLKRILTEVGAHPQTKVRASGCEFNRPSRNFFITITTANPVAATSAPSPADQSKRELIERLGVKDSFAGEQFPAVWKTVNLSDNRKLDLQPGDCELMEGLRDHVLPALSVKIVTDKVLCTPRQLSIRTPELQVSALVPAASPDKPDGS